MSGCMYTCIFMPGSVGVYVFRGHVGSSEISRMGRFALFTADAWHVVQNEDASFGQQSPLARHCVLIFSFGQLVSKLEPSPHRFWKLGP